MERERFRDVGYADGGESDEESSDVGVMESVAESREVARLLGKETTAVVLHLNPESHFLPLMHSYLPAEGLVQSLLAVKWRRLDAGSVIKDLSKSPV